MFGRSAIRVTGQVRDTRRFGTSFELRNVKQESTSTPTDASGRTPTTAAEMQKLKTPDPETVLGPKLHRCSNFDRWMLVWTKRFPNKEAIPEKVGMDLYLRAQSQARIKTANIMMVCTVIGCIVAVISGKRDAKSGKSLHQQNVDWHKEINAEYRASQAAAAAAADVKNS